MKKTMVVRVEYDTGKADDLQKLPIDLGVFTRRPVGHVEKIGSTTVTSIDPAPGVRLTALERTIAITLLDGPLQRRDLCAKLAQDDPERFGSMTGQGLANHLTRIRAKGVIETMYGQGEHLPEWYVTKIGRAVLQCP